jgi:DNA-binding IclR family transcriptional regulator
MMGKQVGGMLAKGLNLLDTLGEYPDGAGVSELAREVRLPVSTVHRLLATMVQFGFVSFHSNRRQYSLGLKVFELSHRVALVRDLSEVALPVMRKITEATGEPTLMSVRDGLEMVYVERVDGPSRIQIRGSVGSRGPLHCTSLGKALLAFLPDHERESVLRELPLKTHAPNTIIDLSELREELTLTRDQGYSVADEEHEEGVQAVGLPIISSRGRPVAAICVAALSFRSSLEELKGYLPLLRRAASEIGAQLPRGDALPASTGERS